VRLEEVDEVEANEQMEAMSSFDMMLATTQSSSSLSFLSYTSNFVFGDTQTSLFNLKYFFITGKIIILFLIYHKNIFFDFS